MDCSKVGKVIAKLRKEKNLKQKDVANFMNLSDKTISKWERGLGCPDTSLLNELAKILETNIETILSGEILECKNKNDNIKNLHFYVCPKCANIITSFDNMTVYCCGKKIEAREPQKATDNQKLKISKIEDEFFIESNHEMTKENYITFVAYLTSSKIIMEKQYPEWNLCFRVFNYGKGKLIWGDNHGNLFYQYI